MSSCRAGDNAVATTAFERRGLLVPVFGIDWAVGRQLTQSLVHFSSFGR
jgi:hypothetical protein